MIRLRPAAAGFLFFSLLATALPTTAGAQGWAVDVQGGRVSYETGPTDLGVSNLTAALRYGLGHRFLSLSAGVPLEAADPLWTALVAGDRLALAGPRLGLGVDLSGGLFLQSIEPEEVSAEPGPGPPGPPVVVDTIDNSGFGATAEVMPVMGVGIGPVRLEGRAGGAVYHSSFGDTLDTEAGSGAAAADATFTRTAGAADLRASLPVGFSGLVSAEVRYTRTEGEGYPFTGAIAYGTAGPVTGWGSVGHWFHDTVETTPWAVGLAVQAVSRVDLSFQIRQDAFDPLFGSLPRRTWSVGATLRLGRRASLRRPIPAVYEEGRASIVVEDDDVPGEPRIAGDFTGWEPVPMEREGGVWRYTVALEPGVYHYAFVSEEGDWFVPTSTPGRRDDGMGGWVAVLVVEP